MKTTLVLRRITPKLLEVRDEVKNFAGLAEATPGGWRLSPNLRGRSDAAEIIKRLGPCKVTA